MTGAAERIERLTGQAVRELRPAGSQHRWTHYRAVLADGQTAFAKVAKDVQDANAAYAGTIAPSKDDPDDPRQPGVLIGSWHDYTPTAALDIDVTRFPVLDGTTTNPAGP